MLTARMIRQMPFVGTLPHRFCLVLYAHQNKISKADVTRRALDLFFDLSDGEFDEGDPRREAFEAWVRAGEPDAFTTDVSALLEV